MKKSSKKLKIKPGDAVVWDPGVDSNLLNGLTEKQRIKYYGPLGYGQDKVKVFVFLSAINSMFDGKMRDSHHCLLVDLDNGKIEYMRHTDEFRRATEDEF